MPLRILLADDHAMFREALKVLLEIQGIQVVSECSDGQEAVRQSGNLHPDVAVLDISMPLLNGVDAARGIMKLSPRTKIIFVTMHADNNFVLEGLRAGVQGYVLKTEAVKELVEAIRDVARGEIYLSRRISRTVLEAYLAGAPAPADPLSTREREVLQLIAEGKTTKEIAAVLGISVHTAESHRTNIMEKLDIHDTAGLVRYAMRRGLVQG